MRETFSAEWTLASFRALVPILKPLGNHAKKYVVIYLYGYEYGLVRAKAWKNIFHKMDTCILGYESECASNRPASKHRFSHNVDIFGLSCPLETCKSKHNNNAILALLATIWGQNCDRMHL